MIIRELSLINFGKFSYKTVNLEPGMNVIYGENEAGKSTLHTFIRGMLFGLERRPGRSEDKDIYSKYKPWKNPANYQGMMRIEQNGVNYRIERNFSEARKSLIVINEDEGRELSQKEIEKMFSGLDEGCYYNTISISQLGNITDKELEAVLKSFATNLGSAKSMDINVGRALADLEEQRKQIMVDNDIDEEINLNEAIRNAEEKLEISEEEQQSYLESIEKKKTELAYLEEKKQEVTSLGPQRIQEVTKKHERRENLQKEIASLTAETEKYTTSLAQARAQKKAMEKQLADKGIDGHETMDVLMERILNSSNMPVVFIIIMMAFIGGAIGFGLGNIQLLSEPKYWIRPVLCLLGALIFLGLAVFKYFYNARSYEEKMETLKDLKLVMDKLDAAKQEEVYIERQLAGKTEALQSAKSNLAAEGGSESDESDFIEELTKINNQQDELREEISKLQWMIGQKQGKDLEVKRELEALEEKLLQSRNGRSEIAAIEEAIRNIKDVASVIRESFGKKLNEKASYYIARITDGKYDNLHIDDKMRVRVAGGASLVSATKLSEGTMEQIYLAIRLAAADIIFAKDRMPILMDDAFAMYDNKRMGNTMKFLGENMDQVLIFSCHTREKLMMDKLGIPYNFIRL